MKRGQQKKITVFVPEELLKQAQRSSGQGISATIKRALEILAAGQAYKKLHALRGRVKVSLDLESLRDD